MSTPVDPGLSRAGDPGAGDAGAGLPAELRRAAAEVIIEKGLGAFSLREVARRAGVSHAAPGYHFGDTRGLLTSLAVQGMEKLHRSTADAAAQHDDPVERLIAVGQAYVRVALSFPAHCEVIWRDDLIDCDDPAYAEAGQAAFGVLEGAIQAIADDRNPGLPVDTAAFLCWSSVQGLVVLQSTMAHFAGIDHDAIETSEMLWTQMVHLMVDGLDHARPHPSPAPH